MQNRYSLKVYSKPLSGDRVAVFARVVSQRKKVEFLLCNGQSDRWNEANGKFKGLHTQNALIEKKKAQINDAFLMAELQNRRLSLDELKHIINGTLVTISWFDFIDEQIEKSKGLVSGPQIRHYRSAKNKLLAFNPNANWIDLDDDFCKAYHSFLIQHYKNHTNTIVKAFGFLRKWAHIAVKDGYLQKNVFKDYKIKKQKTRREYLTYPEVQKLEALLVQNIPAKVASVLRWFLFACYTGLRYSDLKSLKWSNIQDNVIMVKQNKTTDFVKIPLSNQALSLMSAPGPGFVFKMYTNQKCNEYMKIAAMYAGIEKNLTFHIARHTFATISLNIGMRLEVVSELLGHQDLKTTKIYAQMLDETLKENMKLWSELDK